MECLLCTMWARMPYAKRHTTPTTSQETEGALIVGYWLASRAKSVPRVCEQHMSILTLLDQQEERRIEAEREIEEAERKAAKPHLPEHLQLQVDQLQERKQAIATEVVSQLQPLPQILDAVVPSFVVKPQPPVISHPSRTSNNTEPGRLETPEEVFQLGPGPLTNENVITPHPPLPVEADPSAPYRNQINAIKPPPKAKAKPGTMEGALEAAKAPPVEGAKVVHPCPLCGKEVATGDVHAC